MESGSLGCTSERKRSAQEKTQVQRATRFSVHMPVRYRAIGEGEWREGHTENISRTGVLFWVDSLLEPDTPVEMNFTLPVKVGGQAPGTATSERRKAYSVRRSTTRTSFPEEIFSRSSAESILGTA